MLNLFKNTFEIGWLTKQTNLGIFQTLLSLQIKLEKAYEAYTMQENQAYQDQLNKIHIEYYFL